MTTAAMAAAKHLCVVRLSAGSKQQIVAIDALGSDSGPIQVSITCKQVPAEVSQGDVVLIWLGSDNNRGVATKWKQGFRALGKIAEIARSGGFNDPVTLGLDISVVFDESIGKEDIIRAVGGGYARLVEFPVLGLNNYNSQVVQVVDTNNSKQDASEFFRGLESVAAGSRANLGEKIRPLLASVNISATVPGPHRAREKADEKDVYSVTRFCEETGVDEATANDWLHRLERKKQVILSGPPGSGKTWIAQRLAKVMADERGGAYRLIQFHASYTYEDFIGGIRPETSDDDKLIYTSAQGLFLNFCDFASEIGTAPAVLVIDEINRADLSRVFGEAMMLLDYRDMSITLPGLVAGGEFRIPDNVYVVGTMNSADRSIALFDHAMRRRFSFIRVEPNYGLLEKRIAGAGTDPAPLMNAINALNKEINDPDYFVGISFFIMDVAHLVEQLPSIWDGEILPYVRDHFFGRPEVIARFSWPNVNAEFFGAWYAPEAKPADH